MASLLLLGAAATFSAEAPVVPMTVCEVLRELPSYEGKNVAIIGRYSFRETGRWVGQQSCDPAAAVPSLFWLVEDSKEAPKPPGNFELDGAVLNRKFAEMQKHTSLGKFRFGTPDYDRWAVVYGRVQPRQGDDARKAAANLLYRGSGVVIFLTP